MIYDAESADAVEDDLDGLSEDEVALYLALIDTIWDSEQVRQRLSESQFQHIPHPSFDTMAIGAWVAISFNICRIKPRTIEGALSQHRMIYGVDHRDPRIVLLGIMPRSDGYSTTSSFGQRLRQDYAGHHIPFIHRH
ncbi:hypothetical protein [Sphaerotilus sp.]|jgi:hypothetical protein|uniref:hypothetical protein n=1 Tax=Sphaerotilus sp. TaxID=2093942 RepID=UPI0025FB9A26|nr:hypothetical protein [Sphaerotilus sp.]